jgi:hypothetical protein
MGNWERKAQLQHLVEAESKALLESHESPSFWKSLKRPDYETRDRWQRMEQLEQCIADMQEHSS